VTQEEEKLKTAYLNCIGGISGDMLLGALVDAGVPLEQLDGALQTLNVGGFSLSARAERRGGVSGLLVTVGLDGPDDGRFQVSDFIRIVEDSSLGPRIVERACSVFRRLGEAEARVHNVSVEDVQLHELGSLDTLVDVVGAVVGLDLLDVEQLYCSTLPSGSGLVKSAHGLLPAPSPATLALFAMSGAPVGPPPRGIRDAGEMVTPTGAAIATTLSTFRQPVMTVERVGYGLGSRNPESYPNMLALWVGEETAGSKVTDLILIETNIDDMSAELLAYVQERLFDLGARDVWFAPIQMKKNRPATMLCALMPAELESTAVDLVMKETTTLGVRVRPVSRHEAERQILEIETSLGPVRVKVKRLGGRAVSVSPEYEECRRIAMARAMPLQDVYRRVQAEAGDRLLGA
jgi:uncharacterized protein (TIGR00299 family) protein